jgi:hypothetical protein
MMAVSRLIVLLAILANVACNESAKSDSPKMDQVSSALPIVTVTMSDAGFVAPDTISAGLTTIRLVNQTDDSHMAHLIKIDDGHSVDELLEAYAEAARTRGPRPTWMTRFGGPATDPHSISANVTQLLEPGSYAWVC